MDYAVSEACIERVDGESRRAQPRAAEPLSFSEIERSVIHLSQRDPVASIADLHDWRVSVARLVVGTRTNALADKRLEELRRFAILVRVHARLSPIALDLGQRHASAEADATEFERLATVDERPVRDRFLLAPFGNILPARRRGQMRMGLHRILFDTGIGHDYRLVHGAEHVGPSLEPRIADALSFIGRQIDPPDWIDEHVVDRRALMDERKHMIGLAVEPLDARRIRGNP